MNVPITDNLRPGEQLGSHSARQREQGGIEAFGSNRPEIDNFGPIRSGLVHDHKADPAETAVPRLDCRERESGSDHGIDCSAARRQDFGANPRRRPVLRSDDTAAR